MTSLNKHVSLSLSLTEETDRIVDIITSTESVKQKYGPAIFCLSNAEKVGAAFYSYITAAAGVMMQHAK
jgi:hypothetical protein